MSNRDKWLTLRRLIVIALVVLLFFGGKKIPNLITLDSYISTLLLICLSMGIVFEIPVLSWLLARMGLLSAAYMRRYRRHAVVIILVLAAIITPTSDVLTLLAVSLPMWLLYEFNILLVARTRSKTA